MTAGGWIFFGLAWGAVLTLAAWCVVQLVRGRRGPEG